MNRLHRRSQGLKNVGVFGAYIGLTIFLTFPLVTQFTRAIPGDGFDGWQNYWNLWWMKVALLEKFTQPFFTDMLYAPTGVGLLFHTLNPFNGLLTLPVQLAWGLLPAYNAVVIFSFVAGGYGAYLLARHALGRGGSRLAAFAAGVVFAFSPFHFAHLLGHMQVISIEWLPFYALYLLRLTNLQPAGRAPARRDVLLAAFFLILVGLCDWYYMLYCAILTVVIVAWAIWRALRGSHKLGARIGQLLAAAAAVWLVFGLALSPLLVPMVREASRTTFMVPAPNQSRTLSADLLAFVTPQEFHPLWGAWAARQARVFLSTVSEHQVFAGFTVLLAALIGLWTAGNRRTWGPWPLALLTFFVLSLGPVLHVGGRTALLPGGREIPLPYSLLVQAVPFMEISRSVSRFDVMIMLSLAVLAAMGVAWLKRFGQRGHLIGALAIGLILFEFLPTPFPMSPPDTPDWYRQLAADTREGAVLNLPMNWDRPGYLLYQTTHGKPLTVAYISRDDPRTLTDRAPVLQHFRHLGPDIIAFDIAQGRQVLADLGVRWVVLDRYKMPGETTRGYNETLAGQVFAEQTPVFLDQRLTVYEVTPPARTRPYIVLDSGWEPFDQTLHTRAFAGEAGITVQAPAATEAKLLITLAAASGQLTLPIVDGAYAMTLSLQPGANPVALRAQDPGKRVVVSELRLSSGP